MEIAVRAKRLGYTIEEVRVFFPTLSHSVTGTAREGSPVHGVVVSKCAACSTARPTAQCDSQLPWGLLSGLQGAGRVLTGKGNDLQHHSCTNCPPGAGAHRVCGPPVRRVQAGGRRDCDVSQGAGQLALHNLSIPAGGLSSWTMSFPAHSKPVFLLDGCSTLPCRLLFGLALALLSFHSPSMWWAQS